MVQNLLGPASCRRTFLDAVKFSPDARDHLGVAPKKQPASRRAEDALLTLASIGRTPAGHAERLGWRLYTVRHGDRIFSFYMYEVEYLQRRK